MSHGLAETLASALARRQTQLVLALVSAGSAGLLFKINGHIGLGSADEGFLWYGSLAVLRGEVPIRDFQAYEPGRYYWVAVFMRFLASDGLVTLRVSLAACQALAVFLGLSALSRAVYNLVGLTLAGALLLLWMWPSCRAFESALTLAAVLVGTRLLESPLAVRAFEAGVFVGVAAFFGRNHGVYAFVALSALLLWSGRGQREGRVRRLAALGGGVAIGALPLFLYAALVPGFARAELELNSIYLRVGATNLSRGIGLPWESSNREGRLLSLTLMLLPILYVGGSWRSKRGGRVAPLLLASSVVGATYYHHVWSRIDLAHLASAIQPALVCAVALCSPCASKFRPRPVALAVGLTTLWLSSLVARRQLEVIAGPQRRVSVPLAVRGETLQVGEPAAAMFRALQQFRGQVLRPGESILVGPAAPGIYAAIDVASPVWTLFFWFPETVERQRQMIEALRYKNTNWVLLCTTALDAEPELRFASTHQVFWHHIKRTFGEYTIPDLGAGCRMWRRRDN